MKTIQKITADLSQIPSPFPEQSSAQRVETGPLKINDDWTGAFIRGDNCFGYAMYLRSFVKQFRENNSKLEFNDYLALGAIEDLIKLFESTIEQ